MFTSRAEYIFVWLSIFRLVSFAFNSVYHVHVSFVIRCTCCRPAERSRRQIVSQFSCEQQTASLVVFLGLCARAGSVVEYWPWFICWFQRYLYISFPGLHHMLAHLNFFLHFFVRPFVKRFALTYRTVVCPVLSVSLSLCPVCNVGVLWPNGCMGVKLGIQVGLSPGHIVLARDPAPPPPPQRA